MTRLGDAVVRRLASGFVGRVAREAGRRHPYIWGDPSRISVGSGVFLNDALLNCTSGTITISDHAFLGHGVSLLTGGHDYRQFGVDRVNAFPLAGGDIAIGTGAWVASNATVVGPCRVGDHAVVAAGAVVLHDVPAYSLVAGVPARVVSQIEVRPAQPADAATDAA